MVWSRFEIDLWSDVAEMQFARRVGRGLESQFSPETATGRWLATAYKHVLYTPFVYEREEEAPRVYDFARSGGVELPWLSFGPHMRMKWPAYMNTFVDLAEATHADGREFIVEIGAANRLTPLETAASHPNATVAAIDGVTMPDRFYLQSDSIPMIPLMQKSLIASFHFGVHLLEDRAVSVQADRVQCMAIGEKVFDQLLPSATSMVKPGGSFVSVHVFNFKEDDLSDSVLPSYETFLGASRMLEFDWLLCEMTHKEIKKEFGFGDFDSKYLRVPLGSPVSVVVGRRKLLQ